MTFLLKGRRSYVFAVSLALLMHALMLYGFWVFQDQLMRSTPPPPPSLSAQLVTPDLKPLTSVKSSLIIERPPPVVKPPPPPPPKKQPKPKPQKKATKPVAPKKQKAPPKPKKKPEPPPEPVEKRATDELDDLVRELNTPPPQQQAAPAAPPKPLSPEMRVANRFVARIRQQIESAWIQPPNIQYRDMAGLKVLIRLTLEPGGRLVNARILSSSGNTQFDRSALNAVYKVGRFEVPADTAIFDSFFRQVNINYSL